MECGECMGGRRPGTRESTYGSCGCIGESLGIPTTPGHNQNLHQGDHPVSWGAKDAAS